MKALVEDILTFSKLSIEKDSFVYCNLSELLKEVLIDMEETIREKKAEIALEELPSLYVNPGLIRPLFYNLISNALKYSKAEVPPKIRIHKECNTNDFQENEGENKYCRIMIEDNGIGFEQQYSEHIFGMFKRLHLKNKYEGTGIGLALCKKIVEEHNGFISAISKVGEGSTFIISLPLKQPMETETA